MVGWEEHKRRKNMTQKLLKDVFLDERRDILTEKIFSEDENKFTFSFYDVSHSIFPKDDYKQYGVSKFKQIVRYSFSDKEIDKFNEFLEKLHKRGIIAKNFYTEHDNNIFSLSQTNSGNESKSIKNPDNYQLLKLHVSSSSLISQRKIEEFVSELKDGDFHRSNNRVYINNWVHIFLGIDKPYNFDGLKVNEVEYDTSVFLQFNASDDNIKSNWNTIKASLMSARH